MRDPYLETTLLSLMNFQYEGGILFGSKLSTSYKSHPESIDYTTSSSSILTLTQLTGLTSALESDSDV